MKLSLFIARIKILTVLILICGILEPYGANIFSSDPTPKAEAAGSVTTRTNTVEFAVGRFLGDGTTGRNTNATSSLPNAGASTTIRLRETNVTVLKAYIEYNFQLSAYSAQSITSSTFAFDACSPTPCNPSAWAASGNVSSTDLNTIFITSGESATGHFFQDVSTEPQLLNYKGEASGTLAIQAGYRFQSASAANSIANASAKLVITYSYDASSPSYTNTIFYPLESTEAGARGTKPTAVANNCSAGSCSMFNFRVTSTEFTAGNRLSQWLVFGANERADSVTDQTYQFRIGSNGLTSVYTHEMALSGNGGWYEFMVSSSSNATSSQPLGGFSENSSLTLEVLTAGAASNDPNLAGGEIFETYAASSSAATKTRTVRYAIGEINTAANTSYASTSATVFFPEDGVKIQRAWFRLNTSHDATQGPDSLHITSIVNGSQSASTTYEAGCSSQCISNAMMVYHIVPTSTYATIEGATATSGIRVGVSTQWSASGGATSGELVITYTYTGETKGYQMTHSIFAFQSTSTPGLSASSSLLSAQTKEVGSGAAVMNSSFLDVRTVYSSSSGAPTASPTMGATLALGAACSPSNTSVKTGDNENSEYRLHKSVSLSAGSTATSTACASTSLAGMKFGAVLVYTYSYLLPSISQSGYHWRNDDEVDRYVITTVDNDTNGSNGEMVSLRITSSNTPTIAYRDGNDLLRVLRCGNEDCSSGNSTTSMPGTTLGTGSIDMEINASDTPSIAFHLSAPGVKFLRCGNAGCTSGNNSTTLDAAGNFPDIALRANGFPVITYYTSFGIPKVYFCADANCSTLLTSSTFDGAFFLNSSIEVTSSSIPNIFWPGFLSGVYHVRNYQCNSSSSCSSVASTTMETPGNDVSYPSHRLASGTFPVMSYNNSVDDLSVIRCGNTACTSGNEINIVDSSALITRSSLALDRNNNPIIAYNDGTNAKLKIAYCDDQSCSSVGGKETIANPGGAGAGSYNSLAIDSSSLPVFAYTDASSTALKVAKGHFASSHTSGIDNTSGTLNRGVPKRLRLQLFNTNNVTSSAAINYQLQYGERSTTCSAISAWFPVGGTTSTVLMSDSTNITNGTSSHDVPQLFGGISNPATSSIDFTPGFLADTTSTGSLASLSAGSFTELEFSVKVSSSAALGTNYCFRLVGDGAALDQYAQYAEATVASAAPSVSASTIFINNSTDITLIGNSTKTVAVNFQVTDNDGCSDVFTSGNVTSTLFRSGVGEMCTESGLNCYKLTSITHNCSSGTSANATATFDVYYYAEGTDASSSYSGENWRAMIQVADSAGATSTATSSAAQGVEVNSLNALEVVSGGVGYGTITAGTDTVFLNNVSVVKNTGNTTTTLKLSGTALTLGSRSIATSSQHYSTTTFTFGGSEQILSDTPSTVTGVSITRLPIGPVQNTTALPAARREATTAFLGNSVYFIGGGISVFSTANVYIGSIASSGQITSWTATTNLPSPRHRSGAVSQGGYIYVVGGATTSGVGTSTVVYTTSSFLGLNVWSETTALPTLLQQHQVVADNTYIYVLGGSSDGTNTTSTVLYTSSTTNGVLNPWKTTTAFPSTRYLGGAALYGNRIYYIGGKVDPSTETSSVLSAIINSDGTLGSWTTLSSTLPTTLHGAFGGNIATAHNGFIYVMGGMSNTVGTSTILFAPINSDGSLGKWSKSSSTLQSGGVYTNTVASSPSSSFIYSLGGYDGADTSTVTYGALPTDSIYWGVEAPAGSATGTYSGTNIFDFVYSP